MAEWKITQIVNILVFIAVLLLSLLIGLYFSFRQRSTAEYLHGNRNMSLFPVCISLVVSFLSAITMQGVPAEIYLFGIDIVFMLVSVIAGISVVFVTFLPIYFDLKLTSVYEYLEMRYESSAPKLLGCVLDIIHHLLYTGILFYGTALALESLIGVKTSYNMLLITLVCTIYTSLGGLKGVIWTDLFQGAVMLIGLICVICAAQVNPNEVWFELSRRNHTNFNIDPSITQRSSVWLYMVMFIMRSVVGFSDQIAMVRYTAVPTLTKAKLSLALASFFFVMLQCLGITLGIVIFVYYSQIGCGPLAGQHIKSPNEIVPYFITNIIQVPGFVGLFAAGALSATLSTASSAQNAIAGMFLQDIITPFFPSITDKKSRILLKITVILSGILMVIVAFIASYVKGTVFEIANALHGVMKAPTYAMFFLGAGFTFVSSRAAIIGCLTGKAFLLWVFLGRLFVGADWEKPTLIKDTCVPDNTSITMLSYINATENNEYDLSAKSWSTLSDTNKQFNSGTMDVHAPTTVGVQNTTPAIRTLPTDGIHGYNMTKLYSLSPYIYHTVGVLLSSLIGLLLSLIPGFRHRENVNEKLLFSLHVSIWNKTIRNKTYQQDTLLKDLS